MKPYDLAGLANDLAFLKCEEPLILISPPLGLPAPDIIKITLTDVPKEFTPEMLARLGLDATAEVDWPKEW